MQPELREIELVFLQAIAEGYAQSPSKTSYNGEKVITFDSGRFRVRDSYLVTPYSNKSTGQTIIWDCDVPVWAMHYGGQYHKCAIPFLKSCLRHAYVDEKRFYGGRGPRFIKSEGLLYVNVIECEPFSYFYGEERIFNCDTSQLLGYHWYRGMTLTNNL